MDKLKEEGVYEIYEEEREKIQSLFAADFCGEDETVETIYEFFEEYAYPIDTHTACAMYAASGYMAEEPRTKRPWWSCPRQVPINSRRTSCTP